MAVSLMTPHLPALVIIATVAYPVVRLYRRYSGGQWERVILTPAVVIAVLCFGSVDDRHGF